MSWRPRSARRRVRRGNDRIAHSQRHAHDPRRPRAPVRGLVRQASRAHFQHRLSGQPVAHRRPVRRRRRDSDRQRQPRQHLRRDAPDGLAGDRLPAQFAREPASEARTAGPADRNRLVVVEGLYSIRGDVAPLREIASVCRAHSAYLLIDEAHSLGTYGATGLGCAEDQGVLDQADFIVGTFSKCLAGIGGVCVSDHPRASRAAFPRARVRLHGVGIAVQHRERWPPCGSCGSIPSCAIGCGRTSASFEGIEGDRLHHWPQRVADCADPDRR